MNSDNFRHSELSLSVWLDREIEAYKLFARLLSEEKSAIETRNTDGLKALTVKKEECLKTLEAHSPLVIAILNNEIPDGFEFPKKDVPKSHLEQKKELTGLIKACEHANAVNGKILLHSRLRVSRILSFFKDPTPRSPLYNAKGMNTNPGENNVTIAKA